MKQKGIIILLIILLSFVAFAVMYYVIGYPFKKSVWVSAIAGSGMIVFDVVIPALRQRNKKPGFGK